MTIDVVCPLYQAENEIDEFLSLLQSQTGVTVRKAVFSITKSDGYEATVEKLKTAGYDYFLVEEKEFSHSLTRQKAITDYCESDVVVMMSQDVRLESEDSLLKLASAVSAEVPYVYGKQTVKKKTIEYYVRQKNYGAESYTVSAEDVDRLQLKTFFASDAFAAYHRPTFLALGGYDSLHMMMSEDMYYAKKVIDAGLKTGYVADAAVEHSHKLTLKKLYRRYYDTGVWFASFPQFDCYKTTDSGLKLAIHVFKRALKDFNIPVLFRFLPDMLARYLGMKKGKKAHKKDQAKA